jgi:hypothetical protein
MRSAHVIGCLGLAALGVATYLTTDSILKSSARANPPGPAPQAAPIKPPKYSSHSNLRSPDDPPPIVATEVIKKNAFASSVDIVRLDAVANGVEVEAEAVLSNGMEDQRFVWAIAVYDGDRSERLLEHRYDHQVGLSRVGTILRPTFREAIPLPPGEFHVVVSIVEVPGGNLRWLDNPEIAESMQLAGDGRDVMVE